MIGRLVGSVDVQVRTLLLNDEDLTTQAQEQVELAGGEPLKAAPGMALKWSDHP
jgi:hypothetical protein